MVNLWFLPRNICGHVSVVVTILRLRLNVKIKAKSFIRVVKI